MKLIPPAKNCAPVRVGFALHDGVMNAVHPRSHNDQIQNSFQPDRQPPIGMMEQGRGFECDEENEEPDWGDSENDDDEREEPG